MSVHFNGKKSKDLYFNGKKISEAYFNGYKVYQSNKEVHIWRFQTGSNYTGLTGEYSTDGILIAAHTGSKNSGIYVWDITAISGTLGTAGSTIQTFSGATGGYYKDVTSGPYTFHVYKYTNYIDYFFLVLPNSVVGSKCVECDLYEPHSQYLYITAITDTSVSYYNALVGNVTLAKDNNCNLIWTTEGIISA